MRNKIFAVALLAASFYTGPAQAKHHHHAVSAVHHKKTKATASPDTLTLLTWQGYAEPAWVRPFEKNTSCKVEPRYVRSIDEIPGAMRHGGGGKIDLVSAPAETASRLIDSHDVQALDLTQVPEWRNFFTPLKSPAFSTLKGVHYGLSYAWSVDTLLWNHTHVTPASAGWSVLYDSKWHGRVTVADSLYTIADAALYLSHKQPSLKIRDPWELDARQMAAVLELLRSQKPSIKSYWTRSHQEIALFKQGDAWVGTASPYQTAMLKSAKLPVTDVVPAEGTTATVDSWMLAAKARHVDCAYLWLQWVSTPQVQSAQALYYGEAPANALACSAMDKQDAGSCRRYRADAATVLHAHLWKTPAKLCGDGRKACLDVTAWRQAWRKVKE